MRKSTELFASILTICFLAFGIAGDSIFGTNNHPWAAVEGVINLPDRLALYLVGPGHGPAQLVFPVIFSIGFYWVLFWLLIRNIKKASARLRPRTGSSGSGNAS